ncbi:MAG: CDP-alcohol phosphatidyltransferase [Chloroflexi bacterium HGW-Chloroflexi-8]|jgi:phosphatidylglycerophosphate synthase|nr:MAG: CDP-alcohol phosphatidyltransferase [Chloroflexi bacterium HGW-Chloroflexi-8]
MTDSKTTEHTRVNKILLGPIERPILNWLASHMPSWVTPDLLTATGFIATIITAASYILCHRSSAFLWLASFGIFLNWFGDSLDGTLARYRKIERPKYGFFIDHTMDGLGEVIFALGLGLSPFIDFRVALITLVGYMLMANLVYILTYVKGEFRISYLGLGPTEVRLILIITNILVFFLGNPKIDTKFGIFSIYNVVLVIISVLLYVIYMVVTFTNANALAKLEGGTKK